MIGYRPAALAVLLALALLASGCGGGDDGDSAAALTQAEFVRKAEAICEGTDRAQRAAFRAYAPKHAKTLSTAVGEEELITVVGLPAVLDEAEELKALGAPSGDEQEVEAFVVEIEKAVREAMKDPGSVEARRGNPFSEAGKLARAYGLEACAEPL